MSSVTTFTKTGGKASTKAKLAASVFDEKDINHELVKQAYMVYLSNSRQNLAKAMTRGEKRGGGKKPWRQKGTGRARVGSIRVPNWRGGGVVFGPTGNETYSLSMNKKAKQKAIKYALSIKNQAEAIAVIEDISPKEGKTKEVVKLLEKIDAKKKVLIVVDSISENLKRAVNNLVNVDLVQANYLNVFNVMNADLILFSKPALGEVEKWLGKKNG